MEISQALPVASLFACLVMVSCNGSETNATDSDSSGAANAEEGTVTLSATETIASMVADCEASSDARAARHSETPLFERLGGYEKITTFVEALIVFHQENEIVKPFLDGVDLELLTTNLSDFISAGTGGGATYKGQSLPDSHAGMGITPEVFLSAGGDIGLAMQAVGWGPDEQDEFMCIILSMKDDVLMK